MKSTLPFNSVNGQELAAEQQSYLLGFFAGLQNQGLRFSDADPVSTAGVAAPTPVEDLIFEERVKRELHPLDAYPLLLEQSQTPNAPERENIYRFKWQGLFYMTPKKEAYMARLRIPAGQLKTFQLRELAKVAQDLTTGYIQITTRANFQMRFIESKNTPEFLHRIQAVGLHTRGSGADNIRNLTANPAAGLDPDELIDTGPLCHQLGQIIINDREFYDLPRKFNIAFDGGGAIGTLEDTNDIGASAVRLEQETAGLPPEVYFRVKLGGATGHKAFANDCGILVAPADILKVIVAMTRVYVRHGNRTDRKKARLKHLLEKWSIEDYLKKTEEILGHSLSRVPLTPETVPSAAPKPHTHIGVFAQKQKGLNYIGVALPAGQVSAKQLIQLAELADNYGSGDIRLTVWQNLLIPNIPHAFVETVKKRLVRIGLDWKQSNLRSGLIACTGNSYCKFAAANTKGHSLQLAEYLDNRLKLDQPLNIHLTGCPNSCAQHYIGDIGLLGASVKVAGETVEGYHVFVGGGFGKDAAIGRQVFQGISFDQLKPTVEKMLKAYLQHRQERESFQSFATRHDLKTLQDYFCEAA